MLERGSCDQLRVGETLGPEVGPLLRALGAWDDLCAVLSHQVPFTEVSSAWGSPALSERPSVQHPLGEGWHVDRSLFDRALAAWAARTGVDVRFDAGSCTVAREGGGFLVRPRRGEAVWGQQLVDASGRGAPGSSALGRWLAHDRQVGLLGRFEGPPGSGLLLEAVAEGFWYVGPQPDGTLIAALVTDADLVPRDRQHFLASLARTRHTARWLDGRSLLGEVHAFRSDSGRLLPDRGDGWCAVGDAAMATDPLGGNGVARAFQSALGVALALSEPWDGRAASRRFSDYMDLRATYYIMEGRWPDAPFWARRRPAHPDGSPLEWRQVDLALPPETLLAWVGDPGPAAEAWLPPAALDALRKALAGPLPAQVALTRVREAAPIGDQRLLAGLQWLFAAGVLAPR